MSFVLSCGTEEIRAIQTPAPLLSVEPDCRTFPSEFNELNGSSTSNHICRFDPTKAEYSCVVDNYYTYTHYYRSTNDFIDEAKLVGKPRYHAIHHSMAGIVLVEEHLSFSDNYKLIHRSVRDPNAKLTIIDETITAWDDNLRPTRGTAAFDYDNGFPCTGQLLSFQYDEEQRTVTKNYSGGDGSRCAISNLIYQFDNNGNLFTQLLVWHGSDPVKIRRGDIMSVATVCK